jgi:hypothetical protein
MFNKHKKKLENSLQKTIWAELGLASNKKIKIMYA